VSCMGKYKAFIRLLYVECPIRAVRWRVCPDASGG
jgi:hypothetical protein